MCSSDLEVMATFLPPAGPKFQANAVHSAVRLLKLLGYGSPSGGRIPVGVGVHCGRAFCGRIGTDSVHDFTVLGDTVNTAARLQGQAQPGEVVMSDAMYRIVADAYPDLPSRTVELKGKAEPFAIRTLRV